jgi:hypothetical protein
MSGSGEVEPMVKTIGKKIEQKIVVPPHTTLAYYAGFLTFCGVFGFIAGGATGKAATSLIFGKERLCPLNSPYTF